MGLNDLSASASPRRHPRLLNCLVGSCLLLCAASASAQELLDRVIARVNGEPITLSDARAAIALGIVELTAGVDPIVSALPQLVERRLVLAEVARFAPPEPDIASLNGQVNAIKARVGTPEKLAGLESSTGVGETQIREIARDDLRIRAYLNQRFGSSVQATDEDAAAYYRAHLDEFRVNGELTPFAQAEPAARQKAAAARRAAIIFQWMRELRQRADVVEMLRK
jgi:hypothetical protein